MSGPLRLKISPRDEDCTVRTVWDGESALLRAAFEYSPRPPSGPAKTLRDRLDEGFGMRPHAPRLIIGDIDIAYRDERRLDSIELRTAPSSWQRAPIGEVRAASPVWMSFDVEFDDNGIFSIDLPISIHWDAVTDRLALIFAASDARNWYSVADGVEVGTSDVGFLTELRLSGLKIQSAP